MQSLFRRKIPAHSLGHRWPWPGVRWNWNGAIPTATVSTTPSTSSTSSVSTEVTVHFVNPNVDGLPRCIAKFPPLLAIVSYGYEAYVFNRFILPWRGSYFETGAVAYNLLWFFSFLAFLRGCLSDSRVPSDWWRRMSVKAPVGSTLVDVAKAHGVDIQAACGQKLQCATCHVIVEKPFFEKLQGPGVREEDLLDSTFTLTDTSRLGCQVRLTKELDGIQFTLPDNGAKGNVRMTLDMPRPKVQMQLPGVTPAVAPSMKRGGGPSVQPNMEELLERQQALSARLEAHLHEAELRSTCVNVQQLGRKARLEDVIGLEAAKEAIREAILWPAMANQELFSGVRSGPKGLLLYGPPGCGKTMLARAAAVELEDDARFFHVRPGDVMSKFYGESQRRVQALEEVVKEAAPAVVFLDEVDSLLGSRDGGNVAEHHRSTTNALLAWMDGFGMGEERVFFLGATNRAEAIDEAALRRFGDAVEVGAPSLEARMALVRHLLRKAAMDGHRAEVSEEDLQVVGEKMAGYSLADVDRLVRKAFLQVLRELPTLRNLRPADVPPVTLRHFESAMDASSGTSALRQMLRKRADTRSSL